MKDLKTKIHFVTITDHLTDVIKADLLYDNCDEETLSIILNAYNRYQEDERDGVDYIFDITDQDDLSYLVSKCDFSSAQIYNVHALWVQEKITPYFRYGVNYPEPKVISSFRGLKGQLANSLEDFLPFVLMYVTRCEEYQALYEHYVTEPLERADFGK